MGGKSSFTGAESSAVTSKELEELNRRLKEGTISKRDYERLYNYIKNDLEKALETFEKYEAGKSIADNVSFEQSKSGELVEKTNEIREKLIEDYEDVDGIERKNVAIAQFKIGEHDGEIKAYSGSGFNLKPKPEGFVDYTKGGFKTYNAGRDGKLNQNGTTRFFDTEIKLLDNIDSFILKNFKGIPQNAIKGEVKLHTRLETCSSCLYVIRQFAEKYPGIKIIVSFERKYFR